MQIIETKKYLENYENSSEYEEDDDFEIILDDINWYIPNSLFSINHENEFVTHLQNGEKLEDSEFSKNLIIPHEIKVQLFLPTSYNRDQNQNNYLSIFLIGPKSGLDILEIIYNFYQVNKFKIDPNFWNNNLFFDCIERHDYFQDDNSINLPIEKWILFTF